MECTRGLLRSRALLGSNEIKERRGVERGGGGGGGGGRKWRRSTFTTRRGIGRKPRSYKWGAKTGIRVRGPLWWWRSLSKYIYIEEGREEKERKFGLKSMLFLS